MKDRNDTSADWAQSRAADWAAALAGAGEAEPKPESIVHAIAQALDAFDRP